MRSSFKVRRPSRRRTAAHLLECEYALCNEPAHYIFITDQEELASWCAYCRTHTVKIAQFYVEHLSYIPLSVVPLW